MKKTHQEKFNDMLNEGFSKKTLLKMSETQLSGLHKRIVSEQTSGKVTMKASNADPNKVKELAGQGINVELTEKKNQKNKKKNPWAICTSSLSDEFGTSERSEWTKSQMKKYEKCVLGVKKSIKEGRNPYEYLIESMMESIIESHLTPKMSKSELLGFIQETTKEKEKTKEKERTTTPQRKNPYKPAPNTDPAPKGAGTKEKERTKEKEKTTTPQRKNPYKPAPNTDPAPKGKRKNDLPGFLKFDTLNIKFNKN